jgi:glycosyltransferase involved in cell wall biosynthesis
MDNKTLKVAMVCHLSNPMIREHLHLSKNCVYNKLRAIKGHQPLVYSDYAPWNTFIIKEAESYQDLDFHVIAPHIGMIKDTEEFENEGIKYHFYKNKPSPFFRALYSKLFPNKNIEFKRNSKRVKQWIYDLKPDLIVLVGAETPDYSITVLGIKGIPIYILSQAIFNNPEFESHYSASDYRYRAKMEIDLFRQSGYVGVYSDKHFDVLKNLDYDGYIFKFHWPVILPVFRDSVLKQKVYDFVNFAHYMSEAKGYHDSLKALAIVKEEYPTVKLALVDHGPNRVRKELTDLIDKYDLKENVDFIPFFEKKSDLYSFLQTVRFGVLPCKLDYYSGTMLDSMTCGVPIVVYKTEGTPTLNSKRGTVLIAEMENITELASNMKLLLSNKNLADTLRENGYLYIEEKNEAEKLNMKYLVENFKAIIDNYHKGIPIPESMLYHTC